MFKPIFLFFILLLYFTNSHFGQGVWTKKANCPAIHIGCEYFAFSIGDKGYFANFHTPFIPSLWEYDPKTDLWTQKSKFPGSPRSFLQGFSVGNKGYIGFGVEVVFTGIGKVLDDFWEYDPAADSWTKKIDFPLNLRSPNVGFAIGNKGYIGIGDTSLVQDNEFWEYDPYSLINGTDMNGNPMGAWTQKADFAGQTRQITCGFSIGNKGYIGTGGYINNGPNPGKDFWEYDPSTDKWTRKADVPGTAREEASAFSIGGYGYMGIGTYSIGTGSVADFWKYDPILDSWSSVADFGEGIWEMAGSFTIGCSAYVVGGFPNDLCFGQPIKNIVLWQYHGDYGCFDISTVDIKCHGGKEGSITVVHPQENKYSYTWNPGGQTSTSISGLPAGNYTLSVNQAGVTESDKVLIKISEPAPLVISSSSVTICKGQTASLIAKVTGGANFYTYSWNNGLGNGNVFDVSPSATTTYSLAVADANNCPADTVVIVEVNPLPTVIAANSTICLGNSLTLSASGAEQYQWKPSTGLYSPTGNIVRATPLITTNYTVTGTALNGCSGDFHVTVTVNQLPTVECGNNFSINAGESVVLNAKGEGNYHWYPAEGLSCTSCKTPMAMTLSTTTYYLLLTDSNGCTAKDSLTIKVYQQIYIPSSFTPNGDDVNDVFYVYGDFLNMNLKIYNRWGELIFQSQNVLIGWDGKFKSLPVQEGSYIYTLNCIDNFNNARLYHGKIILIR